MSYREQRTVAADHPCIAGHFPGHPVVPGSLLLEEVSHCVAGWLPGFTANRFRQVKFLRPLEPGTPFTVTLEQAAEGRVTFECHCAGELIARGQIQSRP